MHCHGGLSTATSWFYEITKEWSYIIKWDVGARVRTGQIELKKGCAGVRQPYARKSEDREDPSEARGPDISYSKLPYIPKLFQKSSRNINFTKFIRFFAEIQIGPTKAFFVYIELWTDLRPRAGELHAIMNWTWDTIFRDGRPKAELCQDWSIFFTQK